MCYLGLTVGVGWLGGGKMSCDEIQIELRAALFCLHMEYWPCAAWFLLNGLFQMVAKTSSLAFKRD